MKTLLIALGVFALATIVQVQAADNKEKINAMFANVHNRTFPAAAFTNPMPMAVGQWALYGMTDEDGERKIFRTAIIAHEGDAWTIEITTIDEDNTVMMQMTVSGLEKARETKSLDDVEIVAIRMKQNDDEVMTIDAMMLSLTKGMYKKSLSGFSGANTAGDGGSITVPAGTFAGTTMVISEVSIAGDSDETKSWSHPSVPVHGTVKSIVDEEDTMELLDFGTSGATPSF